MLTSPSTLAALPHDGLRYIVDGTAGFGGHGQLLLTSCPRTILLCIDRFTQRHRQRAKNMSLSFVFSLSCLSLRTREDRKRQRQRQAETTTVLSILNLFAFPCSSFFLSVACPTTHLLPRLHRDETILNGCRHRLQEFQDRVRFVHGSYEDIPTHLRTVGFPDRVQGILLDLGANSAHFDDQDRGFSFRQNAVLSQPPDCTL
jgi:16S rRNA C1402 N4-methylase RsmH